MPQGPVKSVAPTVPFDYEPGGGGSIPNPVTETINIEFNGQAVVATNPTTGDVIILNPAHLFQSRTTQSPQGLYLFVGTSGDWYVRDVATGTQFAITDIAQNKVAGTIGDAPNDGHMYVRQNGAWVEMPGSP